MHQNPDSSRLRYGGARENQVHIKHAESRVRAKIDNRKTNRQPKLLPFVASLILYISGTGDKTLFSVIIIKNQSFVLQTLCKHDSRRRNSGLQFAKFHAQITVC